jgi:hypothetical protein
MVFHMFLAAVLALSFTLPGLSATAEAQVFSRETKPALGGDQGAGRTMPDPAKIMRLDRDGDGALSLEEVPERMKARFDKIDGDGDGLITETELETAFDRVRQMREQAGVAGTPDKTAPVAPYTPSTPNSTQQ